MVPVAFSDFDTNAKGNYVFKNSFNLAVVVLPLNLNQLCNDMLKEKPGEESNSILEVSSKRCIWSMPVLDTYLYEKTFLS